MKISANQSNKIYRLFEMQCLKTRLINLRSLSNLIQLRLKKNKKNKKVFKDKMKHLIIRMIRIVKRKILPKM
jgi:hypothetical protein